MTAAVIEVHDLGKRYGERDALRGIDLSIEPGCSVALFGHNGSGKTTFLKLLATLLKPTTGRVTVAGLDLARRSCAVRARVSLLLDRPFFPPRFSLEEGLRYFTDLYEQPWDEQSMKSVLERVGLRRRRLDPLNTFSRGMAQRASLACVLSRDAEILLLDEPYTGLDPDGCALVDSIVDDHSAAGGTTLLVTHEVDRGLRRSDRSIVFRGGRVVLDEPSSPELKDAVLEVLG